MKFELITDVTAWEALEPEWSALLKRSITKVPFLELAYLRAWWETQGGGEWSASNPQLRIITAREEGKLLGIAPLFAAARTSSEEILRFIGEVEVSDYLDFIVEPQNLDRFLSGLLNFLRSTPELSNRKLGLSNIISQSPTLTAIPIACQKEGWVCEIEKLQPSPYIQLGNSYEQYLAGLNKKQRHEIRRKERNAEANYVTDWYLVSDPAKLEEELDFFIEMMRKDPTKQVFLTDIMVQHLKETARWAFRTGQLHLAFLTFDGIKTAAYFSILADGKLWVYNSAWDPEYSQASPGWVLLAKIIRWAIDEGIHEVDMMRGDELYKYRFGGIDRFVLHAECSVINPSSSH